MLLNTSLGIEMYLLLISWGLISEAVFISLGAFAFFCLVFWGFFFLAPCISVLFVFYRTFINKT